MQENFKTIFTGRLDFANSRSFDKVVKLYDHRMENYYKTEVLLQSEEVFNEEKLCLDIPRFITLAPKKKWQNTINLLNAVAEYAVAGDIKAWMMLDGKLIDRHYIEPDSDKTAVKEFQRGRKLLQQPETMEDAFEAFTRAIAKFDKHAVAYERRGFVNFSLKNYEDAIYDYTKSIKYNDAIPQPYLGRGLVQMNLQNYKEAIEDFDQSVKRAMPLQSIYWHARRVKADCLMALNDYEGAVKELTLFSKRRFTPDNRNFLWRKKIFFNLGKCLMELERYKEAVEAFTSAIEIEEGKGNVSDLELLVNRGISRKKGGMKGFRTDWQEAADKGSEAAAELLSNK
ncbi:MAG: tetratricopeptide repeat protein [Bacteroidetes bacterium]|nr:MAG: tetratricopeptide repeat protein [Bacteroidota bacterium]